MVSLGVHLVKKFLDNGNLVIAADIKPKEYWFQDFDIVENNKAECMQSVLINTN